MEDLSFIFNAHPSFIESMYKQYQDDVDSVEEGWRLFFKGFDFSTNGNGTAAAMAEEDADQLAKELRVLAIIKAYRDRGHLRSTTNPIRARRDRRPNLDLADFDLTAKDLDTQFIAAKELGLAPTSLKQIISHLEKVYCGNIGFEYSNIQDREKRRWLRAKIEKRSLNSDYGLSIDKKKRILEKLNGAVGFEKFLHTKYVGQKRFSLEGGESTIAAVDAIISAGAEDKVKEVVIGMAHRGRLNVLANIMGKTYDMIFNEFEGTAEPDLSFGDGDVKYHLGYSSQVDSLSGKKVYLKLVPNPSHL